MNECGVDEVNIKGFEKCLQVSNLKIKFSELSFFMSESNQRGGLSVCTLTKIVFNLNI